MLRCDPNPQLASHLLTCRAYREKYKIEEKQLTRHTSNYSVFLHRITFMATAGTSGHVNTYMLNY